MVRIFWYICHFTLTSVILSILLPLKNTRVWKKFI
nr:MAG TPA: hypothetical protein [Caudoviricetes sp.]